jgi:Recombination endonuclease VII
MDAIMYPKIKHRKKLYNSIHGRNVHLLNKYDMTEAEYEEKLVGQSNKCAICGDVLNVEKKHPPVDHNHSTGQVRGILCQKCNLLLGLCNDSIDVLERTIGYLRRFETKP